MKRILFIVLTVLCCTNIFADKYTPSNLSPLYLYDRLDYRREVCKIEDPFSGSLTYIYECVDDTINPHHLRYELVLPALKDNRINSLERWPDHVSVVRYGSVGTTGDFMTLFLGYTKEQAKQFFDDLYEFKTEHRMLSLTQFKSDFTELIYHFKGQNMNLIDEMEDKVYIRSMRTDIKEKYFLFRTYYCEKSYIAESSLKLYKQAIDNYKEAEQKAPCVNSDPSELMDMSEQCNYKKLSHRWRGFGANLTEFEVFVADNPQYDDERFFAICWDYKNSEVLPLGRNVEDAYRFLDAYDHAVDYAYKNKLGWFKKVKLVYTDKDEQYPGEDIEVGNLSFYLLGEMQRKKISLIPYRYGCRSFTVNKSTINEMRRGIDNYVKENK